MANKSTASHGNQHGHEEEHGSVKTYTIGFLLSLILTIIPIGAVVNSWFSKPVTTALILILAVAQFGIQLIFFMHLRDEKGPRFNLFSLIFGLVILVTIVAGSIWIMTYNAVAQ